MSSLTATAAIHSFREGRLSPVDEIEECLRRIDTFDPVLRAWVELDRERCLVEARARFDVIRTGGSSGALFAIAVGVKDIIDVAGLPTRAGAAAFAHRLPTEDAAVVAALRRAGAIVLGKTATTQFAYTDPAPTRNPWNPDHTPGGSSSGSAAAVAAGMAPLAIGSQTVGSVLRPAAYCGVVGFKPSHGRISVQGVHALAPTLDHIGIFSRCVGDVGLVLRAIADPAPVEELSPLPPADGVLAAPPSLGLLRSFYAQRADAEVTEHIDSVVAMLGGAGAWVEQVSLPFDAGQVLDASNRIVRCEAARYHRAMFSGHEEEYAPNLRRLIATGLDTPEAYYRDALARRDGLQRAFTPVLEAFDALLLPTAPSPAPKGLASTGDPVFCALASVMGVPSISLPSGISGDGLPLAIQLVGRRGGEVQLLAVAAWVESQLGFSAEPPLAPSRR